MTMTSEIPVDGVIVLPNDQIPISAMDESKFVDAVNQEINSILKSPEWIENEKKCNVALAQYNAALKREGAAGEECEIDIPSTARYVKAAIARFMMLLFGHENIFVGKPKRPSKRLEELATQFGYMSEKICTNAGIAEYRKLARKMFKHFLLFPKVVLKASWQKRSKKINDFFYLAQPGGDPKWGASSDLDYEQKIRKGVREVDLEPRTSRRVVSPFNFIHRMPAQDLSALSLVAEVVYYTKSQIVKHMQRSAFRKETRTMGRSVLSVIGSPTARIRTQFDDDFDDSTIEISVGDRSDYYKCYEVYTTYREHDVVLIYEAKSKAVLSWMINHRDDHKLPYKYASYEEAVLDNVDGVSFAYEVEPYHRLLTVSTQQRVDAASFANKLIILLSDELGLSDEIRDGALPSGAYEVSSLGGPIKNAVEVLKPSQPWTQLQNLEEQFHRELQMLAGFSDYNFGQEQISRPTAAGQQMLISEGQQPWFDRIETVRTLLAELLYMEISLYKQHKPEGWRFILEEEDETLREVMVQWPSEYWENEILLETAVSSKKLSKETKRQEWLGLVQKLPEIFQILLQFIQMVSEGGLASGIAASMVEYYVDHIVNPWLEAFGVEAPEELKLEANQMLTQQIDQLSQAVQQGGVENERLQANIQKLSIANRQLQAEFIQKTQSMPKSVTGALGGA